MMTEIRTVENLFGIDYTNTKGPADSITTAYACVRLIAQTIASTNIDSIDKKQEIIASNPLDRMLNGTKYNFFNSIMYDYLFNGNGYALILDNELIYLPQNQVQVYITNKQSNPYYYQVSAFEKSFQIWPENMIHIRNITSDGINGLSPISVHKNTFDSALSMSDYQSNFVENSAAISGIITTDKKMNKETIQTLRENFSNKFSGSTNSGKVPVLTEGMKFDQLKRISPIDMDYLKQAGLNKSQIAEIFGVPLTMLGTSDSTYSNSETHALMFQNYTLTPIMSNIEQELKLKLKVSFRYTVNSIKLSSAKDKSDSLSLLVNTGIITANEARKFYNLPSMTGGDELKKEENLVGNALSAPKDTVDTNKDAGTDKAPSKRSREDIEVEIHRLKSELGRI